LAGAVLAIGSSVLASDVNQTWIGGSGNWSDATKWSANPSAYEDTYPNNIPGLTQSAIIGAGAGTVTLTEPIIIDALTLRAGALTGSSDLTLNNAFNWSGGSLSGSGSIIVPAGSAMSMTGAGGPNGFLLARTIQIGGTADFSGDGDLSGYIANCGLNVLAGGSFTVSGIGNFVPGNYSRTYTVNNAGTLAKTSSGTTFVDVPFNNSGLVHVQAGTLQIDPAATSVGDGSGGTFLVDSGATLLFTTDYSYSSSTQFQGDGAVQFVAGTHSLNGAVFQMGGTVTISGAATVDFGASTVAAATTLADGGTLLGSGDCSFANGLSWTGGKMSGSGKTIIPAGTTLSISGSSDKLLGRTLEVSGNVNFAGSGALSGSDSPGAVNILSGGTFTIADIGTFVNGTLGGSYAINNAGTFVKNSPGTTTVGVVLNNTGTVHVQTGTLALAGGGNSSATFQLDSGTTLAMGGDYTFNGGLIQGPGAFEINNGNVAFNGTMNVTNSALLNINGPNTTILTGSGTVSFTNLTWSSGVMSGTGTTAVPAGATLSIIGDDLKPLGRTLDISGTVDFGGSGVLATYTTPGAVLIEPGGIFKVSGSGSLYNYGATPTNYSIINAGTFIKTSTGTTIVSLPFNNIGAVDVEAGTLDLQSTVSQYSSGVLDGGTWTVGPAGNLSLGNISIARNATITLTGAGASFSGLEALNNNQATLNIMGGQQFATTAGLANSGRINIGSGSALAIKGALTNTGTIDVSGSLLVQATAGTSAGVLADITNQIKNARNTTPNLWQGTGITSSAAAADARQLTGLAVILNQQTDAAGHTSPIFTQFAGQTVDQNSILVKYTWNGDANLDGRITFDDYYQANLGFLSNGKLTGYRWGDFNYDGKVNFDDYYMMNQSFLKQGNVTLSTPALAMEAAMAAVPEPGALGALLLAAGMLLRRRRTQR
jgi:hypothetical protein